MPGHSPVMTTWGTQNEDVRLGCKWGSEERKCRWSLQAFDDNHVFRTEFHCAHTVLFYPHNIHKVGSIICSLQKRSRSSEKLNWLAVALQQFLSYDSVQVSDSEALLFTDGDPGLVRS